MKSMKRPNMLSATFVKTVNAPGRYGDGRGGLGLSLLVRTAPRGHVTKCWTQSVRIGGRPTSIGLGRYPVVTLALARQRALENAQAIAEGRDPRRRSGRGDVRGARPVPPGPRRREPSGARNGHEGASDL